jgi:hypothetical protein
MSPSDSKHQVASAIVHAALKTAGVRLAGIRSAGPVVPESVTFDQIFPLEDDDGRARFESELAHAAQRLELNAAVLPVGPATLGTLVASIAALLPARLFRCQDSEEVHVYKEKGTGKCRIDGTELVEVFL